jgi:hypothetical protein
MAKYAKHMYVKSFKKESVLKPVFWRKVAMNTGSGLL